MRLDGVKSASKRDKSIQTFEKFHKFVKNWWFLKIPKTSDKLDSHTNLLFANIEIELKIDLLFFFRPLIV